MKRCPKCNRDRDIFDFGTDRSRKDGINIWCKSCCRSRTRKQRKSPAYRKACIRARPIWMMKDSPQGKVWLAIQRGAMTQPEIGRATHLPIDEICDAIAMLYDAGRLDLASLRRREYIPARLAA